MGSDSTEMKTQLFAPFSSLGIRGGKSNTAGVADSSHTFLKDGVEIKSTTRNKSGINLSSISCQTITFGDNHFIMSFMDYRPFQQVKISSTQYL